MARSLRKGPFVDPYLLKKVQEMDKAPKQSYYERGQEKRGCQYRGQSF